MGKDLDELVEIMKQSINDIAEKLESIGATKKTIDLFFEGEDILICPSCCTFNFIEAYYDKLDHYSIYHCGNCFLAKIKYWEKI